MSIRTWSLLGTAIAVLPILGFAAWIVSTLVEKERADADREIAQRSQAVALSVKRRFDRAQAAIEALAVSSAIARGDFADVYGQAQKIAADHPEAIAINMVKSDGSTVFSTARSWGGPVPVSRAAPYERRVFAQGTVVYTPLFMGLVTKRQVMAVSVPVRVQGEVRYSLRMTLPTEALSAVLKDESLPAMWTSAVVDPNGVIAGRSSDEAHLIGQPVSPSLQHAISSHAPCPFQATTHEGARVSSCVAQVPGSEWVVAIGVPTRTFDLELRNSLIALLVAGVVSLAVAIATAVRIANAMRAQIKLLTVDRSDGRQRNDAADPELATIREVAEAARSIAASREREGELETELIQAKHDALTGLPARTLFRELVEFDISRADASARIALLFIDLDGFKAVNDSRGHDQGDRLLKGVAEAIRKVVRTHDVACRLGGDEFLVYLRGPSHDVTRVAAFVAQRLIDQISASTELGCSVGVAIGPCNAASLSALLNDADHLMMKAKAAGKGRFVLDASA